MTTTEHRCPYDSCDAKRFTISGIKHHVQMYHGDSLDNYQRVSVVEWRGEP